MVIGVGMSIGSLSMPAKVRELICQCLIINIGDKV